MGDQLKLYRFRPRLLLFVAAVAIVVAACGDREAATTTPDTDAAMLEGTATPTGYESPLTAQAFAILKELTDDYSPRESLTEEEFEASRHLLVRLKQLGYATSVQEFDVTLHRARVVASSQDFDNTIAMLNFDAFGSGTKLGITGDDDLVDAAKQIGAEKDIPLFHRVRPRWAGDHAPFLREGIPVFRVLSNDQGRINSPEDEIQHINPDMLGYAAEIGIGILDWLADNPEAW